MLVYSSEQSEHSGDSSAISRMKDILLKRGEEVSIEEFRSILLNNHGELFMSEKLEFEKYSALDGFCGLLQQNNKKEALVGDLIDEISRLEPIKKDLSKPRDWNEAVIFAVFGNLGMLIHAAIDAGDKDAITKIYQQFRAGGRVDKMRVFLERLNVLARSDKYKGVFFDYMNHLSSIRQSEGAEMKALLDDAVQTFIRSQESK